MLGVKKVVSPVRFFDDGHARAAAVGERAVRRAAGCRDREGGAAPGRVGGGWRAGVAAATPLRLPSHPIRRSAGPPLPTASGLVLDLFSRTGTATPSSAALQLGVGGVRRSAGAGGRGRRSPWRRFGGASIGGRRAIVLVPEAAPVPATAAAIVEAFGERVAMLVGGDKRARYRTWLEIADGRFDVVVGTRPAVFAPVANVGAHRRLPGEPPGAPRGSSAVLPRPRCGAGAGRARRSGVRALRAVSVVGGERARRRRGRAVDAAVAAGRGGARRPGGARAATGPRAAGDASRLHLRAAARVRDRAGLSLLRSAGGVCGVRRSAPVGGGHRAVHRVRGARAVRALRGGGLRSQARRRGTRRGVGVDGRSGPGPSRRDARPGPAPRRRRRSSSVVRSPCATSGPATSSSSRSSTRTSPSGGPGWPSRERALATWMEAVGWARPSGRAIVQADRPSDPAIQALVRGNPDRFHADEAARRAAAGFPVGSAVFRIAGSGALEAQLADVDPITLLVSSVGEQTVCLLALEPGRVDGVRSHDPRSRGARHRGAGRGGTAPVRVRTVEQPT